MATTAVMLGGMAASMLAALGEPLPTPDPSAAPRMLVLRNGRVLEGRVTRVDEDYVVDFGNGQMRIDGAEVEFVCDGLEDAYQRKRAALRPGSAPQHLDLAQWCLRHDLPARAADELAAATAVEPDHPKIAALRFRLDMAREPQPTPQADVAHPPASVPADDELDRMIRSLPRGTVETFAQSVQPVLVNRCAAGGCHGPQADDSLRLFRVSLDKRASRRVTQRNLHSVLALVDRDDPLASRLLTVPKAPHGGVERAMFDEHQAAQYQRLVDWVVRLSSPSVDQALPDMAGKGQAQPDLPLQPLLKRLPPEAQNAQPLSVGDREPDLPPPDAP